MIEKRESNSVPVAVVSWGPTWADMQDAARYLGAQGLMFQIKWSTPEEERRGIDILPELHLYDWRYRVVVVTPGLYVVIHPGERNFRVLNREMLEEEYGTGTTPDSVRGDG